MGQVPQMGTVSPSFSQIRSRTAGSLLLGRVVIALLLLGALEGGAWASSIACPEQFLDGEAPDVISRPVEANARQICFLQFAVLHSSATRTPLWSAEHLTKDRINSAEWVPRKNTFHPEASLPTEERAELVDYKSSGYDRGHMAPSGDMPDSESQRESFSLANMIPQDPNSNRGIWARLEGAVRQLTRSDGEVYVITGPIFRADDTRLHGRVSIPAKIFKAIYDPAQKAAGVYVVDNAHGSDWQVISLAELKSLAGLDAFPKLEQQLKDHAMELPPPTRASRRRDASMRSGMEASNPSGRRQ